MFKVYEFHWKAINRFQQKQKGKLLARNQDELEQRLIKKGFQQIKISRNFILPKNPNVTDYLIKAALDNKYGTYDFIELNNDIELNANKHMVELLKKSIK